MEEKTKEVHHFAYIDTLRGIAFLAVLAVHSSETVGTFPGCWLFWGGSYGVQLFFLVSAITMCYSASERKHRDLYPWTFFYIRRLFRIAPLFWLGMLFYWTVPGQLGDAVRKDFFICVPYSTAVHPWQFVVTTFFMNGWCPYVFDSVVPGGWSISIEMNFYIIFPLLYIYMNSFWKSLKITFILMALTPVITGLEDVFYHHLYGNMEGSMYWFCRGRWLPSSLFVFCTGICTYHFLKSNLASILHKNRHASVWLFIFCSFFLVLLFHQEQDSPPLIITMLAGMIIALASPGLPWVVNPVLCYIGKISFSCYLTHFFMIKAALYLLNIDLNPATMYGPPLRSPELNFIYFSLTYLLALVFTIFASTITRHLIEKPGIALGQWIIQKIEQSSGIPSAVREHPANA